MHLYTDSQYLRRGVTEWVAQWKRNGWLTRNKTPVKNADLWERLDQAAQRHEVQWFWVKGHAGHPRTNAPTSWPARARPRAAAQPAWRLTVR